MSTRRKIVLVVGALAVVVVVIVVAVTTHDSSTPLRRANPSRANTPGAAALSRVVAREHTHTFHAVYDVRNAATGAGDKVGSVELWRKPPRVRQDLSFDTGGTRVRQSSFITATGAVVCVQSPASQWTCNPQPAPSGSVFDQVVTLARDHPVVVTSQKIGDRAVQCFSVGSDQGGDVELCATSDGVPVRVGAGGMRYELVSLSTAVPDSAFDPPAGVTDTTQP